MVKLEESRKHIIGGGFINLFLLEFLLMGHQLKMAKARREDTCYVIIVTKLDILGTLVLEDSWVPYSR